MAGFILNCYSISELLKLLAAERGEAIHLKAGCQPVMKVKSREIEITGPEVTAEILEELIRAVASTRDLRSYRQRNAMEILYTVKNSTFLVRAVNAFGELHFDLQTCMI